MYGSIEYSVSAVLFLMGLKLYKPAGKRKPLSIDGHTGTDYIYLHVIIVMIIRDGKNIGDSIRSRTKYLIDSSDRKYHTESDRSKEVVQSENRFRYRNFTVSNMKP